MDAVIISDVHLGSDVCQAKLLRKFLKEISQGTIITQSLILNGDIFDNLDFRRLAKSHWKILAELRKLSNRIKVVWVNGNHDILAKLISPLVGAEIANEYVFESGGKKVCCYHGHRYDTFIYDHPVQTEVADWVYWGLQQVDPTYYLARLVKQTSKTFLRNSEIIEAKSIEYATKKGYDIICAGHTHMAACKAGPITYANSGCWTESPCNYLTIKDGQVELREYLS